MDVHDAEVARVRSGVSRLGTVLAVALTGVGVLTAQATPATAAGIGPVENAPWVTIVGTEIDGVIRTVEIDSQIAGPGMSTAAGVTAQAWVGRESTDGDGTARRMAASATTDTGGNVTFRISANQPWTAMYQVRVPEQGGVPGGQGNAVSVPGVHLVRCVAVVTSLAWVTGGRPGLSNWRASLVPGSSACARPGLPTRATVALRRAIHRYHWSGHWHARVTVRRVTELVSDGQVFGHRLATHVIVTRAARTVG